MRIQKLRPSLRFSIYFHSKLNEQIGWWFFMTLRVIFNQVFCFSAGRMVRRVFGKWFFLQSQTILILATVKVNAKNFNDTKWIFAHTHTFIHRDSREKKKSQLLRQGINKQINKQTKRKVISFYSGEFFFAIFFAAAVLLSYVYITYSNCTRTLVFTKLWAFSLESGTRTRHFTKRNCARKCEKIVAVHTISWARFCYLLTLFFRCFFDYLLCTAFDCSSTFFVQLLFFLISATLFIFCHGK